MLYFLQIEGTILHQEKDYYLLYCSTCFIMAVWNQTCNTSEVCLYYMLPLEYDSTWQEYLMILLIYLLPWATERHSIVEGRQQVKADFLDKDRSTDSSNLSPD